MICSVEGCNRDVWVKSRGWCQMHYARWNRHGDVSRGHPSEEERFFSRVDKDGPTIYEGLGPCWVWTGGKVSAGYGGFTVYVDGEKTSVPSHRWSYVHHVGPIPAGLFLRHRCDNPPCVNPEHLEPGTQNDNVQDRQARGRTSRGTAHYAAKLTEWDVRDIREIHRNGCSAAEIARGYKVGATAIERLLSGRTWSHVQDYLIIEAAVSTTP